MSEVSFWRPERVRPGRYGLEVTPLASVGPPGRKFLMGGVGLAASIDALEQESGRCLLWANAQYLSFAVPGATVEIEVDLAVEGRNVTQARAVARCEGRVVLQVQAALGGRADMAAEQLLEARRGAPPASCSLIAPDFPEEDDLSSVIEKRRVFLDEQTGRGDLWIALSPTAKPGAGPLAILADHLPGCLPRTCGASSLDNTLRIHARVASHWFLLTTTVTGLSAGVFHGRAELFSEDGTLVASASQSGVVPRQRGDWAQSHVRRRP